MAGAAREQNIDLSALSEMHAAALLKSLNAEVEIVAERIGVRTPDIWACWGGECVDVEVARGEKREVHLAHEKVLASFMQAVSNPTNSFAVFIACDLDDNVLHEIVNAMVSLVPGQVREARGKWAVTCGEGSEGDRFTGGDSTQKMAPAWWNTSGVKTVSVSRMINGTESPAVYSATVPPRADYLNPVRRKAERPQRTGEKCPYLIALETSQLPDAHLMLTDALGGFFPQWSHVSGVLLFYPFFHMFREGTWRCSLISNPHAERQITNPLLNQLRDTQKVITAWLK